MVDYEGLTELFDRSELAILISTEQQLMHQMETFLCFGLGLTRSISAPLLDNHANNSHRDERFWLG